MEESKLDTQFISASDRRDLSLSRFLDVLTGLLELVKPAIAKAVADDLRGK